MQKPNLLLIIADDHQHNAFGRYRPELHTPNFDRLMREGLVMNRAYMTGGMSQAVCSPSRCSLHTGMSAIHSVDYRLPETPHICNDSNPRRPHLGESLAEGAYERAFSGKWHSGHASLCRSFDHASSVFFGGMSGQFSHPCYDYDTLRGPEQFTTDLPDRGDGRQATDRFTDAALDFLKKRTSDKPFFLNLAYTSPHDPKETTPQYHALYEADKMPLPENFLPEHPFDNGELNVRDEGLASHPRDPDEIRQHLADYAAMVSHNDASLGRILYHLEKSGELDDTLVIYTSDHGLAVGQHGLMGKQNMYEHSIRIPMVFRGPGIPAGAECDALVCLFDLFPTLCEWADLPFPSDLNGRSFAHLFRSPEKSHREEIHCFYKGFQRCLVTVEWKLARSNGVEQLFHLKSDPLELKDRIHSPDDEHVLAKMRLRLANTSIELDGFLDSLPKPNPVILSRA